CRSHQRRNFTLSRCHKTASGNAGGDCTRKALNKQKLVASKNRIEIKATAIALIFLGSIVLVRADQMIESVQQALKDQGFYYGEITGEKNANLTAAIRRFQIRNGLQINGELNSETLRSLGIGSSASAQPVAKAAPSPTPSPFQQGDESSGETADVARAPAQAFGNAPQDRQ